MGADTQAKDEGEFVFVYSTFGSMGEAERAAEALVREKLAACVNIHGGMRSVYEWKGTVEKEDEVAAFIKTRHAVSEEDLDAHCVASGLARFKRPRRYEFIEQIPKSPVGKILRRVLVADYSDPQPAEQP